MIFEEESSTDYNWKRRKSNVNRHNPIDVSSKNRGKGKFCRTGGAECRKESSNESKSLRIVFKRGNRSGKLDTED